MEIIIRRVGMEDHINIVKLFQVSKHFTIVAGFPSGWYLLTYVSGLKNRRMLN